MKIKPEHFQHLKQHIEPLDTEPLRHAYKSAGLSDVRYQWDLLRKAGLIQWICDNLYSYLDDSHINTALRNIVTKL